MRWKKAHDFCLKVCTSKIGNFRLFSYFILSDSYDWDYNNADGGRIYDTVNNAKIDVWEHYVFISSHENKYMKVYLNNVEVISDTIASTLQDSVFTLAIGGADYSGIEGGLYYIGSVDDFRVYNRALSKSEVQDLYNEGQTNSIEQTEENLYYTIFPNPTAEHINIKSDNTKLFKVKVLSITGMIIRESELCQSSCTIDLNSVSIKGVCFVQILDENNKVMENKKIILQ